MTVIFDTIEHTFFGSLTTDTSEDVVGGVDCGQQTTVDHPRTGGGTHHFRVSSSSVAGLISGRLDRRPRTKKTVDGGRHARARVLMRMTCWRCPPPNSRKTDPVLRCALSQSADNIIVVGIAGYSENEQD